MKSNLRSSKISVWPHEECDNCPYTLSVSKVIAKAHGVLWFDNSLVIDKYTRFPITLLAEEGKHASCTDKNGDGYYTPGYDVNRQERFLEMPSFVRHPYTYRCCLGSNHELRGRNQPCKEGGPGGVFLRHSLARWSKHLTYFII